MNSRCRVQTRTLLWSWLEIKGTHRERPAERGQNDFAASLVPFNKAARCFDKLLSRASWRFIEQPFHNWEQVISVVDSGCEMQGFLEVEQEVMMFLRPHNFRKTEKPRLLAQTGFKVEMQGFEPWSRQGNQRAFYVRIYAWIFMAFQAHIRPLKFP